MPTAHPSAEILAGYAAGSLSAGMSLLAASHLTFCPRCRAVVSRLEALAGALLREETPAAPSPACLARTLARLDAEAAEPAPPCSPAEPGCPLPAPLRGLVGPLRRVPWRAICPGVAEHHLPGFPGEEVLLMRADAGSRVPQHTHDGHEVMLVLQGRLRDDGRVFARGDVASADARHDHAPEVVGSEPCMCLLVLANPLRYADPNRRPD